MNDMDKLKRTPLYDAHVRAGGRMVPFSGWEMPVQYTGILEEHLHTRSAVGIFDICHMGEFVLSGPNAFSDVDRLVTCDMSGLVPGKCKYGFLLNEDACMIDDLIVFRTGIEEIMLVVNAGTISGDADWIKRRISRGTVFNDISAGTAKIDIQGPLAPSVMDRYFEANISSELKRFNFKIIEKEGERGIISATGYTGEKGYELFIPSRNAESSWEKLLSYENVKPAGLGARDSLRLEMGYPLYGHDIDPTHTPFEAGLMRFVDMKKDFIGRKKLADEEKSGAARVLTGFIADSRRSAREGFVVKKDGKDIGVVTSGVFSPCLKKGIGLFYIDRAYSGENTQVVLSGGNVEISAVVNKPPFVR
ncbi:MAG: glycine cleavage system aminomethyltransferase GcvT [Candidatus Omnitrophica bacterium]|nr:glycine cleavage system aminomethyltransferase GcvT [Candidatus Omnitrophota bacterium]